jgi:glycosyltransferase involved in cell wall biosynthesis
LRILCIGNRYPPWSTGGYELTWAAAVDWLRGAGHAVRVLTTLPDPADDDVDGQAATGDVNRELRWYWAAHRFPKRTLSECLEIERANAAVLGRHLQEFSPEVVMWWAMGGMSLSLLEQVRRRGVPAVSMVGDEWPVYGPEVDGWTRHWRGWRRSMAPGAERTTGIPSRLRLEQAALWSFNSAYTRTVACAAGLNLVDAAVDHPGIDLGRFRAAVDRTTEELWRWRLLYLGRIDPRKGIATAIRALAFLPHETRLTVYGSGDVEHLAELQQLAHQLSVAEQVSFRSGTADEVPEVYAACDGVVFPVTWREPWGLVPLEAMASRRPVVASRSGGGTAEYLENGRNCLQFEPEDAAGLAAAVTRLAEHPGLRDSLVRAGHATARRYTQERFHTAMERRLDETVARGPLP